MGKITAIAALLLASMSTALAYASCIPGSAFHHGEPGSKWAVETSYSYWTFDIDSEESLLHTIPNDAQNYVLLSPAPLTKGAPTYIQCTYGTNLKTTGTPDALINFDAFTILPMREINMELVRKNFQQDGNDYICYFPAGNLSVAAGNNSAE